MKKILVVLILAFVTMSCSDDDAQMFFFELVPTASVENVPENFILNKADTLVVRFSRPSLCHSFQGAFPLIAGSGVGLVFAVSLAAVVLFLLCML